MCAGNGWIYVGVPGFLNNSKSYPGVWPIQYHRTEDPDRGGTNWWLHMHYSNGVGYGPWESDKYDGLVGVRGGEVGYELRSWQRVKSFAFGEPLREGDFLAAFSRVSADVAFE